MCVCVGISPRIAQLIYPIIPPDLAGITARYQEPAHVSACPQPTRTFLSTANPRPTTLLYQVCCAPSYLSLVGQYIYICSCSCERLIQQPFQRDEVDCPTYSGSCERLIQQPFQRDEVDFSTYKCFRSVRKSSRGPLRAAYVR